MTRFGIRKVISHYINSDDRHIMLNCPSQPEATPKRSCKQDQRTVEIFTRPTAVAEVPATHKVSTPVPPPKPSVLSRFVLGRSRGSMNQFAELGQQGDSPGRLPSRLRLTSGSMGPELLRYLGGGCQPCAVCGQGRIGSSHNSQGICQHCNDKIHDALQGFKQQQDLRRNNSQQQRQYCPYCVGQPNEQNVQQQQQGQQHQQNQQQQQHQQPQQQQQQREQQQQQQQSQRQQQQRQQRQPQQQRQQQQQQREQQQQQQQPQQQQQQRQQQHQQYQQQPQQQQQQQQQYQRQQSDPPFNIIVLQDCNNSNLIDQLTAALTVGCQQISSGMQQPQPYGMAAYSPGQQFTSNSNGQQQQPYGNLSYSKSQGAVQSSYGSEGVTPVATGNAPMNPNQVVSCNCDSLRCLKLPMLLAEALEVFLKKNKHDVRRRKSDGKLNKKKSKSDVKEVRSKGSMGSKASTSSFGSRMSGDSRCYEAKERRVDKSGNKKAKDKFKEPSAKGRKKQVRQQGGKRRRKDAGGQFFLPESNKRCLNGCQVGCQGSCRNAYPGLASMPYCTGPCCSPNYGRMSAGSRQDINNNPPYSRQSSFKRCAAKHLERNGGGGDQPGGSTSCPSSPNSLRPSPRDIVQPVAHFRPGSTLYPANYGIHRNGNYVRRSLVRTAAGITLHEVQRDEELEQSKQKQSKQPWKPRQQWQREQKCASQFRR